MRDRDIVRHALIDAIISLDGTDIKDAQLWVERYRALLHRRYGYRTTSSERALEGGKTVSIEEIHGGLQSHSHKTTAEY